MNRYAFALLLVLIAAGLLACESADGDQANVTTKPAQVAPNKGE